MRPSGSNEGPTTVVVDKSSKSSSSDNGEERDKQMGDHLVTNMESSKILQRMTAAIRDLVRMDHILRENDVHPESIGHGEVTIGILETT
jgi:hypothetical protein